MVREDPRYPARLRHLHDPPAALFCRGRLEALHAPTVAIVGSRRATVYGRRVAEALSRSAVRLGWTVVSGMAMGVDGAAHRGCLEAGGVTVAVLGNGPDRAYPRGHTALMDQILLEGLVMSEYASGVSPRPYHFPRRNRLLAALANRVVVVEAAQRSGALITAGVAAELGREVCAVPGSIFSENTGGTHRLIEDGATPVTSLEAWEASLRGGIPGREPAAGPLLPAQLALGPAEDGLVRTVWDALEGEPRSLDGLSLSVPASGPELLRALARLELGGWVERGPGATYLRATS